MSSFISIEDTLWVFWVNIQRSSALISR